MQCYILDDTYGKVEEIDQYQTFLWTEQYNDLGNFELVVPATEELYSKLPPGTFIGNSNSLETGVIMSREIKNGSIHLSGNFLMSIFKYRVYRATPKHQQQTRDFSSTPGEMLEHMVDWTCVNPIAGSILDATYNKVTNLVIGTVDASGTNQTYGVTYGELWAAMKTLADEAQIGMRLRATKPSVSTYTLTFDVWYGVDRTRSQSTYPAVVFDPALDTLAKATEFESMLKYYNYAYVCAPNVSPDVLAGADEAVWTAAAPGYDPLMRDWDRRTLYLTVDELGDADFTGTGAVNYSRLLALLELFGKNALANNNYVRLADGEIVPQIGYQYGVDYNVGDIIELRGRHGTSQRARVTEYIRSQDGAGYREYPTLSIVD